MEYLYYLAGRFMGALLVIGVIVACVVEGIKKKDNTPKDNIPKDDKQEMR